MIAQNEIDSHPNGNGNGNGKIFKLAPVQDDLTLRILQARREVLTDSDLSVGAKVLFCFLLDLSLLWTASRTRGVVVVSAMKLAESIHCCRRSVFEWQAELVQKRFVWITKLGRPNMWPMNVYHIAAVDQPDQPAELPGDGLWGNGAQRAGIEPGLGARKGLASKLCTREKTIDPSKVQQNAPSESRKVPLSGANPAIAKCKPCDCQEQTLRLPIAKSATANRKECTLPVAKNAPSLSRQSAHFKEPQSRDSEPDQRGKAPSPPKQSLEKDKDLETELETWRATLAGQFPSRLEKLRVRLVTQRDNATAPNLRQFLTRKVRILNELIDGPAPEPEAVPVHHTPKPAGKPAQPTQEDLVEGAKYLVQTGKEKSMTPAMKEAYEAYKASTIASLNSMGATKRVNA